MAKFKIGDKVKVLDGSNIKNYTDGWANRTMGYTVGLCSTVRSINCRDDGRVSYSLDAFHYAYDERGLELVEKALNNNTSSNTQMPEIIDYTYNSSTGETTIKWSDKTETTVRVEIATPADQFTGFVVAYAKKAAGNTSRINSLYDKWAIKKPIKDKLTEEKRIAQEVEEKRIVEKRKAKREKWLVRKEALRIKREYEARKLANEKYGVPLSEEVRYVYNTL